MPNDKPKSWREVLPIHPAAELFPRMSADELRALGEDIKKNGLKIPVTAWFGKGEPLQLLDGRNQLDAMEAVDIPVKRLKMAPVHRRRRRHPSMGATVNASNTHSDDFNKRSRRRGDYIPALQKTPVTPKTWTDHGIPNRWQEKIDSRRHPHIKPTELASRQIAAVTKPGDLMVDRAAGSFVVLEIAKLLGRRFIGCDAAWTGKKSEEAVR